MTYLLDTKVCIAAMRGNAKVIHLPEVGLFGNGHGMFFERNNVQIADLISQWLKDNGLDKH